MASLVLSQNILSYALPEAEQCTSEPRFSHPLAITSLLVFATAGLAAIAVRIDDSVPNPNPRTGSPDNVIIDDYQLTKIAEGTDPLENPSGPITTFGFLNATPIINGTKTEPDENLYVVFGSNPGGPTANFNYGRHFLYQGHENSGGLAYVTRINLDVTNDPAHRITLLTPVGQNNQTGLSSIDGSTFDPFSQTLLFTQENAATKGVIEISSGWPATIRTLEGFIGTGGFEGIHPDGRGDLLIIEDVSGTAVNVIPNNANSPKTAHQPNSFVYRYHPYNPANLAGGGTLYALQVWIDGQTLTFHANDPVGDTFADVQVKLRKRGAEWGAMWVQIHDTNANGSASFSANAAAKAAGATPFKRPENAQFQPGTDFDTFYFVETGDTDADAGNQQALADRGAWGSIFRVNFDHNRQWGVISNAFCSATRSTRRSTTSRLPISARCSRPRTVATACTNSSGSWIPSGPFRSATPTARTTTARTTSCRATIGGRRPRG